MRTFSVNELPIVLLLIAVGAPGCRVLGVEPLPCDSASVCRANEECLDGVCSAVGREGEGEGEAHGPWQLLHQTDSEFTSEITVPPTQVNSLIVVATELDNSVEATDVTDDGGNVYVQAPGSLARNGTLSGTRLQVFFSIAAQVATTLSVVSPPSTDPVAIVAWEVQGIDVETPFDAAAAVSDELHSTTPQGPEITTSVPGAFVISAIVTGSVSSIAPDNEFTNDTLIRANGWAHLTSNTADAGLHQAAWLSDDSPYCATAVAFRPAPR